MNISTILDHIDNGHMALPEFQRGYVWNGDQVRGLMQSLYRRYPVGSLLVWATQSEAAEYRGDEQLAPGVVKLLLDGQQRITSLYGIIRGKPPAFFDGSSKAFTGLRFHLEDEEFRFFSPIKMRDDPLWIDVSRLFVDGLDAELDHIATYHDLPQSVGTYMRRLNNVFAIRDIDLHVEEVTGDDKTIDVVVDIFNRVNSGGTKLSKGDLALAKVCVEEPEARERMKLALNRWKDSGFNFSLDWLLRCANTITTGEARFEAMHHLAAADFTDGLKKAERSIDYLLNAISGRFGIDHDRVYFGRYAMPVMAHYLDRRGGRLGDPKEMDKLLFWYLQCAMWGRYSGSTESFIDRDLKLVEDLDGALDRLIEELQLWRGSLNVLPEHFAGWSLGARFYPTLYMLTRVGQARDWGTGLPLTSSLLGNLNKLEVHHIFPKAVLYRHGYGRSEVNAIANFCLLTKDTNLQISDSRPDVYFPDIESRHPGALASQWIPMDTELWQVENYSDFLAARQRLLAEATNQFLEELLHGEQLADVDLEIGEAAAISALGPVPTIGGVDSEDEEAEILACNDWIVNQGLPEGEYLYELSEPEEGRPIAILDLAWPNGLQEEFSQPVAVLISEGPDVLERANAAGFRYFTSVEMFKQYVRTEIIAEEQEDAAA
jgi:hypothetical protein